MVGWDFHGNCWTRMLGGGGVMVWEEMMMSSAVLTMTVPIAQIVLGFIRSVKRN